MIGDAARYDGWHAAQTLIPLIVSGLGVAILWRGYEHLGKVVMAYAITCIVLVLAPMWLGDHGATGVTALRPVLIETKVGFVIGLALILAAGGRTPEKGPPGTV